MKNRNIVLCIILSILTCGIYGWYWITQLNNDMCALTPEDSYQTSGVKVVVFSLLTCGIYSWYWLYKMGQKMDQIKPGNHAILFLALGIFGLGIINYCIMQGEINARAN